MEPHDLPAQAGIIVFGSLMGAMFIGQQYLQNVLGYSTLQAGTSIIPAAVFMVLVRPRSAGLVDRQGARFGKQVVPLGIDRAKICGRIVSFEGG
jgi:hypothetical protein